MRSFRIFNRRAGAVFAAAGLVLTSTVPAIVAAATVTERSVALSSSTKSATGVDYEVKFKAQHASTGAFVVDFCTTPDVGTTCATPTGLDVGTPGIDGGNTVSATDTNTVKVVLASAVGVGGAVDVKVSGLTNTSTTGVMYARIVTYADSTAAGTNDSETPGTHYDDGAVALSITDGFGVTGAVLEELTFCASGAAIPDNCVTTTAPEIELGSGGVLGSVASEGTVYTKLSTNAAGGAIVNLRSDATGCGGLVRQGATSNALGCGIAPIIATNVTAIADDAAQFGLKLGTLAATDGQVNAVGNYSTTKYYMGYAGDDNSGVTGPYGDTVYNTNAEPVNGGTADLTFAANKSPITPAGSYSAKFSLIATGTF